MPILDLQQLETTKDGAEALHSNYSIACQVTI
ncbi:class III lanthipeptide [Streptomyces cinnamoneus]|nr:class III lanthipeptide [Streptomyces sichuanensis]MCA6092064.1 class III lanthipeptide [Streptomyces sichuanensis]